MSKVTKTPRVPEDAPLSEQEKEILLSMHDKFGDKLKLHNENTLLRYIRGYKDDPHPKQKALDMLGAMLDWREQNKIDELRDPKNAPLKRELFNSLWPTGTHGIGKNGHLVYIERVGQVDGSRIFREFSMDEVIRHHCFGMEQLTLARDSTSTAEQRRYKQIVILDVKGLGMGHLGSKFLDPMKKFIKIDQDMYPETLYVMIVVNAGWILKTAWAVVKPFIDPITRENIKFGNEELTNYITPENIPVIYGGACGCEGGKCLVVPFKSGQKEATIPNQTTTTTTTTTTAMNNGHEGSQ